MQSCDMSFNPTKLMADSSSQLVITVDEEIYKKKPSVNH